MNTIRTYYENTKLSELSAQVIDCGEDENGSYVVCDKTIFHPQGGGQPDDQGIIECAASLYKVQKLSIPKEGPDVIKHYIEGRIDVGSAVTMKIDLEARWLFARLHSAGHLLSNAAGLISENLDGCQGNHFPNQSFVRFQGVLPSDLQSFKKELEEKVNELVKKDIPVSNRFDSNPRKIQFGDLREYPCGGTHVSSSSEIGDITIRRIKKEKDLLKVSYDVKL
ncbi:MAG: hypothetical protein KDK54_22760 [Leptospiraceae bacterium]|nr:hypothetical protein [Leptospiraceae bacterium]